MNDKLNVFEILSEKEENQEQSAPDFDLLDVKTLMERNAVKPTAPAKPQQPPQTPTAVKRAVALEPVPAKTQKPAAPAPATPKPDPVKPVQPEQPKLKSKKFKFPWPVVKASVLVAAVVLFIAFVLASPKVTVNSMEPLISNGDRVVINKLAKSYNVGDVIVFKTDAGQKCVARIVADSGDAVSLNNVGGLYVNNSLQEEENIHTVTTITDTAVSYPVLVGEDSYFVHGDNRTASVDSRNYEVGLVDKKDIQGKLVFCIKKIK